MHILLKVVLTIVVAAVAYFATKKFAHRRFVAILDAQSTLMKAKYEELSASIEADYRRAEGKTAVISLLVVLFIWFSGW